MEATSAHSPGRGACQAGGQQACMFLGQQAPGVSPATSHARCAWPRGAHTQQVSSRTLLWVPLAPRTPYLEAFQEACPRRHRCAGSTRMLAHPGLSPPRPAHTSQVLHHRHTPRLGEQGESEAWTPVHKHPSPIHLSLPPSLLHETRQGLSPGRHHHRQPWQSILTLSPRTLGCSQGGCWGREGGEEGHRVPLPP